jgi:hypothetical protein
MDQQESPDSGSAIRVPTTEAEPPQANPELLVDLTEHVVIVNEFHVDDRVERLASETERSHWGTITSRIHLQGRDDWLVVDNDGVTHLDPGRDLAPARRGRFRRQLPPDGT